MTDSFFFSRTDLDRNQAQSTLDEALNGADDGELYFEYAQSETFAFDDNRLKRASFNVEQGFGLRAVCGEATGYAHASELSPEALKRAARAVQAVKSGSGGVMADGPARTNARLYPEENPLGDMPFEAKTKLLEDINAYARAKDARVRQVSCSLTGSWSAVEIMRAGGAAVRDFRPLVRLNVSVTAGEGDRQETGTHGAGGREGYAAFVSPDAWRAQVDEALRQALINLEAEAAPAGEMEVVLGSGWTGVLLHEAVGHGLEGDFNRKGTSAFAGRLGERVAAPGVTVVDDGTIAGRRGSLTVDDEGTPTSRTVLIEDGVLKGYLQDRMNARLMGAAPTGNGRRESFTHQPMPRMTNTFMLAGERDPAEILSTVKELFRRTGGHHVRQVRFQLHRGVPGQERQGRRAPQKRRPDRRRPDGADQGLDDRQRLRARSRRRRLRQGRTGRAGRRRSAHDQDRRSDGGRRGGVRSGIREW